MKTWHKVFIGVGAVGVVGGVIYVLTRKKDDGLVSTEEVPDSNDGPIYASFIPTGKKTKTSSGPSTQAQNPWDDQPENGLPATTGSRGVSTTGKKTLIIQLNQNTVSRMCWDADWESETSVSEELAEQLNESESDCKSITFNSSYKFVESMIGTAGGEQNWDLGLWPEVWPKTQTFRIETPNGKVVKTFSVKFDTGYPTTLQFELDPGYYIIRRVKEPITWSLDSDLSWQDKKTWKARYSELYVRFFYFVDGVTAPVPATMSKQGGWALYLSPSESGTVVWMSAGLYIRLANVAGNKGAVAKAEDVGMGAAHEASDLIEDMIGGGYL